ncbi:MAG: DUF4124 domain-containing protein [Burkholderiales bacterium]|nr:DUF4124 domain-containing protein [Burkholderiales bacterium]
MRLPPLSNPARAAMLLAALGLALAAPAAAQQVYKWVDETGRVHYSNSPPPQGAARGPVQSIEQKVTTVPSPVDQDAVRDRREQELRNRVEQLERERDRERAAAGAQPSYSAAAQAEAERRWREQCRANRGTDCEGTPYYEPAYGGVYPMPPVVRPPIANRPGFPSVVPPGYTVGPGPGGIGGAYVPMPPPPRPDPPAPMAPPRPRPTPLQQ